MWRREAAGWVALKDGMAVDVHGSISLYEAGGQYQLYADALHRWRRRTFQEFLRLKAALEAEDCSMALASAPSRNSAPDRDCDFPHRRSLARYA